SSKNSAWNCFSFAEFLEVNIHHSVGVRISFLFIAYMHDDLCRKIRDYIQSFGKGCRIIRRAEFLEEIR
ncbi:MAG: hypothetical protein MJE68_29365, partial [Proteobacteria bacterium]|nr:hypothetical protein [Pseudomonadota bacterium]